MMKALEATPDDKNDINDKSSKISSKINDKKEDVKKKQISLFEIEEKKFIYCLIKYFLNLNFMIIFLITTIININLIILIK